MAPQWRREALLITAGLIYIGTHFVLYALVLRRWPIFGRERVIFGYHLGSAVLIGTVLVGWIVVTARHDALAAAAAVLAMHGIYNLSFLELWSLSEGSYSLSILEAVAEGRAGTLPRRDLEAIGASKRTARLDVLQRMRLLRRTDGIFRLTLPGRIVASGLALIRWISCGRRSGG